MFALKMSTFLFVLILFLSISGGLVFSEPTFDSPLFPDNHEVLWKRPFRNAVYPQDFLIPKNFWISFREYHGFNNLSDHVKEMAIKNAEYNWTNVFLDNAGQEEFLETYFPNTSVLWAYRIIHPDAKVAASDIWRISMLYVFGGFYMDDDAYIRTPFDKIIRPDDELVIAQEGNSYRDDCYIDNYRLSNANISATYNTTRFQSFYGGRNLVNWGVFVRPRLPLMLEVLQNVIDLVKREYFRNSAIKMHRYDAKWKYCMCVTGPVLFSATIRLYTLLHDDFKIRVMKKDFIEYGGMFKVNINVHYKRETKDNYMYYMQKHNIPFLREYAPLNIHNLEGHAVAAHGAKTIYFVQNGMMRVIPDYDTFMAMKLRLQQVVKLDESLMKTFPVGDAMPRLDYSYS